MRQVRRRGWNRASCAVALVIPTIVGTACGGRSLEEDRNAADATDGAASSGDAGATQLTHVVGTIGGVTLFDGTAVSVPSDHYAYEASPAIRIQLSARQDACASVLDDSPVRGETQLTLIVVQRREFAIAPGTYPVIGGAQWGAAGGDVAVVGELQVTDDTCSLRVPRMRADGGSVTITSMSPGVVMGTFSLLFASGEAHGNFAASTCIPNSSASSSVGDCVDGG